MIRTIQDNTILSMGNRGTPFREIAKHIHRTEEYVRQRYAELDMEERLKDQMKKIPATV